MRQVYVIGFPTISKLIRGHNVELEDVCFIPDDQLLNESKNNDGVIVYSRNDCISFDERNKLLCKRCPYSSECKAGEIPGSDHCFAVLQRLNPLEN